jgi:hypothetical protein
MAALIYYMHDGPTTFRFELSGDLAGVDVNRLAQAWRTALSTMNGKILAVDATYLTLADEKGRALLSQWWHAGAHFIANTDSSRELVESITGAPYNAPSSVGPTFDPRFAGASLRAVLFGVVLSLTLLFPVTAWAR